MNFEVFILHVETVFHSSFTYTENINENKLNIWFHLTQKAYIVYILKSEPNLMSKHYFHASNTPPQKSIFWYLHQQ